MLDDLFSQLEEESTADNHSDIFKWFIKRGTGFSNGKQRVMDMYSKNLPKNERVSFLINEYGIGGFAQSTQFGGLMGDYGPQGISFVLNYKQENEERFSYSWNQLESELDKIIQKGEYL